MPPMGAQTECTELAVVGLDVNPYLVEISLRTDLS